MSFVAPACLARPATLDDLSHVAELLHCVFGVRQTVASLRWKLTGCTGRLIGSTVLIKDSRIVGFLGQIPVRLNVIGHEVLAAQGSDVCILEEYRRLDAFLALVQTASREMRTEGVALTYGIANAMANTVMGELLGPKRLSPIPLLVRPLSATDFSLGWPGRMLARVLNAFDRLIERKRSFFDNGFRLSRVERFDKRFDAFWREIRDDYPVMVVRDAAHLNWRYVDTPGIVYERLCIEHGDRIRGYAVLGLRQRNGRLRGHIADLVTMYNGDQRIAHALIQAALGWFRAQAVDVVEVWAFPHMHLRCALVLHGFVPRRSGPGGFQASALAPHPEADLSIAEHAKNWCLAMGDSDMV